jgi:hypothetical protein
MKFENTAVWGFEHAIRGMRNPKNSWALSDSHWVSKSHSTPEGEWEEDWREYAIGPKDMKLMQTLIKAGPEHRKFMRQIFVSVDITAPLYWWKEFDTYKVGTVANSTSTMHKLTAEPITMNCFEKDDFDPDLAVDEADQTSLTEYGKENGFVAHWHVEHAWYYLIDKLEDLRQMCLNTEDPVESKKYWKELVRMLPEAWLQKRTVTLNYENLLAICSKSQRRFHKLTEWSDAFINWARTLPYAQELIFIDEVTEHV